MSTKPVLLALAITGAAVLPGAAPGRASAGDRVVIANASVEVTKRADGEYVARSRSTGHRTALGTKLSSLLIDVDGNYVGFARRVRGGVAVLSIDARSGKVRRRARAANAMGLQVRRTGTVVWVSERFKTRSVHARTAAADVVLGSGEAIDPRSLAIADSDATTTHVYWVDGSDPKTASVE